jgi:hypothetical protein
MNNQKPIPKPAFPKQVYVCWMSDPDGHEISWMMATTDPKELAELGESVNVGVYALTSLATISAEITVERK